MDYKRVHDLIIEKAKTRVLEGYSELHHIIPKSMGGSNKKDNLVRLAAKEHFLIHRLLTLIYPDSNSIAYAYWAMCGGLKNKYTKQRYSPSAKAYEDAKNKMSEYNKKRLTEYNIWNGKKHSEESKLKQSTSAKNRNINLENEKIRRAGISKTMKELPRTEEWNRNISEAKKGSKNPMYGKTGKNHPNSIPIERYSLDGEFIDEWDSTSQASSTLGLNSSAINQCIKGRSNSSGGFKWKKKQT